MLRATANIVVLSLALTVLRAEAAARADRVIDGPVAAQVIEVVDGDTLRVRATIWIGQSVETLVRLRGIDAPELRGKCEGERARAQAAREFLGARVATAGGQVRLSNLANDKYGGRVLADVATPGGNDLALAMIEQGLARPYAGAARAGWCDGPAPR